MTILCTKGKNGKLIYCLNNKMIVGEELAIAKSNYQMCYIEPQIKPINMEEYEEFCKYYPAPPEPSVFTMNNFIAVTAFIGIWFFLSVVLYSAYQFWLLN